MTYTDEKLISELQRFYDENGRVPVQLDMQLKYGYPSFTTYINHFKPFNSALEIIGFEINNKHQTGTLDGTETCSYCGLRADEIIGFEHWHYVNDIRYCKKHGNSGSKGNPDYVKGELDINSSVGRGRVGEILVVKTLGIGKEHDYNRISCGYSFDLYNEEFGRIDVKTSLLSFDNRSRWKFNFQDKSEIKTYICIGLSLDRKFVQHVWIVPNKGKIRNLITFTVYDTYRSLSNRRKWEVDANRYDYKWQTMKLDNCKIMVDKNKPEIIHT